MAVRMFYFAMVYISTQFAVQHTFADPFEPNKPLPTADEELVGHFRLALDAVFGMGIRLQALVQREQGDNFLVSPLSSAAIVGQLLLGAEGEFREQLVELLSLPNSHLYKNDKMNVHGKDKNNESYSLPYSTLHLQLSGLLKGLESAPSAKKHFTLKEASAIFFDKTIQLKERFEQNLKDLYSVRPCPVDFKGKPMLTHQLINNWALKNTNGLIKTVLPQPPPPSTMSIMANAVYFLAEWDIPFSDELNHEGPFSVTATKQVQVTYMMGLLEQIFYSESDDYRMVALPYKDEELGMYILLPRDGSKHEYDMKSFALDLKAGEILDTIAKGRRRDVVVKIPKMTVSSSFSILDQLKKYRVFKKKEADMNVTEGNNAIDKLENKVEAFNNFTANVDKDIFLTNAAVNGSLRIGDIVQQVVITVNEKGTEAAAISASTIDYIGGSKNFILNRPFLFFIRHEATSATLFWGTIANPVSS